MTIEIVQADNILTIENTEYSKDITIIQTSSGEFEIEAGGSFNMVLSRKQMEEVRDWINERLR